MVLSVRVIRSIASSFDRGSLNRPRQWIRLPKRCLPTPTKPLVLALPIGSGPGGQKAAIAAAQSIDEQRK